MKLILALSLLISSYSTFAYEINKKDINAPSAFANLTMAFLEAGSGIYFVGNAGEVLAPNYLREAEAEYKKAISLFSSSERDAKLKNLQAALENLKAKGVTAGREVELIKGEISSLFNRVVVTDIAKVERIETAAVNAAKAQEKLAQELKKLKRIKTWLRVGGVLLILDAADRAICWGLVGNVYTIVPGTPLFFSAMKLLTTGSPMADDFNNY